MVDSDMQLNNKHRMYCYFSTATMVIHMCHNVVMCSMHILFLQQIKNVKIVFINPNHI